jgi:3-phosphoshikimate 1-carboxyvinyltransferase
VHPQPWNAPYVSRSRPVVADVRVPGSKSMTNRALVLGALGTGCSRLGRPLRSRDTALMVATLRALGTRIDDADDETWTVGGDGGGDGDSGRSAGPTVVDVGNAGTVLRFVPAIAGLSVGDVGFDGDPVARQRPVGPLLGALRELGVRIDDGGRNALPFTVHGGGGVRGGEVTLDASSSSQLVSAPLLAGAAYERGVVLRHVGERAVPNAPHVAMTVAMLRERGVDAHADGRTWAVRPGPVAAYDGMIEPDLSSAAPFLAAAVVTGGQVRVADWPLHTTQPGGQLPELLQHFGASVWRDGDALVVTGDRQVKGVDLDLRDAGELTPVLAAIAAVADGPSRLRGIDYLRGHETNRLAALARELTALGGVVTELDDGLAIRPKRMHGGVFSTYDDHRLAMAGAVLGLVVSGVRLDDVATTGKTLPGFAAMWADAVAGRAALR